MPAPYVKGGDRPDAPVVTACANPWSPDDTFLSARTAHVTSQWPASGARTAGSQAFSPSDYQATATANFTPTLQVLIPLFLRKSAQICGFLVFCRTLGDCTDTSNLQNEYNGPAAQASKYEDAVAGEV